MKRIGRFRAKAKAEKLFERIVAYTRQFDGQLRIGLDTSDDQFKPIDYGAEFEQLRQPIFAKSFYLEQWLVLNQLARQRGESNDAYLKQIDEFIRQYGQ